MAADPQIMEADGDSIVGMRGDPVQNFAALIHVLSLSFLQRFTLEESLTSTVFIMVQRCLLLLLCSEFSFHCFISTLGIMPFLEEALLHFREQLWLKNWQATYLLFQFPGNLKSVQIKLGRRSGSQL